MLLPLLVLDSNFQKNWITTLTNMKSGSYSFVVFLSIFLSLEKNLKTFLLVACIAIIRFFFWRVKISYLMCQREVISKKSRSEELYCHLWRLLRFKQRIKRSNYIRWNFIGKSSEGRKQFPINTTSPHSTHSHFILSSFSLVITIP